MNYSVRASENVLFAIKVIAAIFVVLIVFLAAAVLSEFDDDWEEGLYVILVYIPIVFLYIWFYKVYLVAYMKGNGICVSETQFKEIFEIYRDMAQKLGIKKIPPLFILQQGGMLNAFAVRLSGKNYIAIYSDIFALYKTDIDAVAFVLAHEIGHVKRKHNQKRFWTFPSVIIPFLNAAYSRACEYTCDNIGGSFISDAKSRLHGILALAGGTEIYKDIDVNNYLEAARKNRTFSVRMVNMFLSHPYLPQRIENLQAARQDAQTPGVTAAPDQLAIQQ